MKRYVKLDNGLLDISEFIITETEEKDIWGIPKKAYEFKHKENEKITFVFKEKDILGDSDDMMKLCDFYCHNWYGHPTLYKNYESAKRALERDWGSPSMDGHGSFYGLIWVSGVFGLIDKPTLVPVCEVPFHSNGEAVLLPWKITREI